MNTNKRKCNKYLPAHDTTPRRNEKSCKGKQNKREKLVNMLDILALDHVN